MIETGTGIVHVYVWEADFRKLSRHYPNAKTSRPSVCNAMEVLLVNRGNVARPDFLPLVKDRLVDDREIR